MGPMDASRRATPPTTTTRFPSCSTRARAPFSGTSRAARYIDMMSAYSAVSHGHAHPRILAALDAQARRLAVPSRAYYNDRLGPFLAEALRRRRARRGAADEHRRRSGRDRDQGGAALGLPRQGRAPATAPRSSSPTAISTAAPPPSSRSRPSPTIATASARSRRASARCRSAISPRSSGRSRPNTVAVLIEPIQGEAGIIVPPAGWLAGRAPRLCDAHRVLLIVDEVQSGLGRTGAWFAFEHEGVRPDGLVLGKALGGGVLPVSAFVAHARGDGRVHAGLARLDLRRQSARRRGRARGAPCHRRRGPGRAQPRARRPHARAAARDQEPGAQGGARPRLVGRRRDRSALCHARARRASGCSRRACCRRRRTTPSSASRRRWSSRARISTGRSTASRRFVREIAAGARPTDPRRESAVTEERTRTPMMQTTKPRISDVPARAFRRHLRDQSVDGPAGAGRATRAASVRPRAANGTALHRTLTGLGADDRARPAGDRPARPRVHRQRRRRARPRRAAGALPPCRASARGGAFRSRVPRALQARGLIDDVRTAARRSACSKAPAIACGTRARNLFWMGYGPRSDRAARSRRRGRASASTTVALELADPRFYHIDTALCPLPRRRGACMSRSPSRRGARRAPRARRAARSASRSTRTTRAGSPRMRSVSATRRDVELLRAACGRCSRSAAIACIATPLAVVPRERRLRLLPDAAARPPLRAHAPRRGRSDAGAGIRLSASTPPHPSTRLARFVVGREKWRKNPWRARRFTSFT